MCPPVPWLVRADERMDRCRRRHRTHRRSGHKHDSSGNSGRRWPKWLAGFGLLGCAILAVTVLRGRLATFASLLRLMHPSRAVERYVKVLADACRVDWGI
jgi:hypothetical protein